MDPQERESSEVTRLLHRARDGDAAAFDELYGIVYEELRKVARGIRRPGAPETINTTALVHEAYLRLLPSRGLEWNDRSHFFGVAARAMRQVLMRAAERSATKKRGGGQADLALDEARDGVVFDPLRLLDLDAALAGLEKEHPRQARVVECRFFAGLSVEETAVALGISEPTVKRDWRFARAWLAGSVDP